MANPASFEPNSDSTLSERVAGLNTQGFPVERVSWDDAVEFCRRLSLKEGKRYRLPTEAEWECAARACTTTRFSYGDDDVNYSSLTNYAWFLDLGHPDLIVHPVGQKLPNPWGLYDMSGNVWEWCQDWYGDQVGGVQTDPQGPAANAQGAKVMRGGAYDYDNSSCRSASRFFRFAPVPPKLALALAFSPSRFPLGLSVLTYTKSPLS
jgi:formylglycine-generating enzyme required for sulfatase activity